MSDTVLVVGAGTMGAGIAQVAALGGFRTLLYDAAPPQVARAMARIAADLDKGVQLSKVIPVVRDDALARIAIISDLAVAAGEADVIIEAIVEDLAIKQQLFRAIVPHVSGRTILATNTSALSITEIGASTSIPERVIGMHFFNPVPRMSLIEVVRGLDTSDVTSDIAFAVARRMGKEPIAINEFPGFATSRVNVMIGNEAFYMLMEGVGSARDIDKALKLGLNHPMGPFELGDLVGWDVRLKVLQHLHRTLGEKFRPCPLLVKYVNAGRLGRKSGRGVYEYAVAPEGQ